MIKTTLSKEERKMEKAQLYTIIALCVYAIAMALIGCFSYGKSKTLDGFLLGGRNVGAWVTAFAYRSKEHTSELQSR